jgi:hypothetical protein
MAPKDELRRIRHDTPVRRPEGVPRVPEERNAMALATVEVPRALVCPLRETVLLLYQATAEALHCALRAHSEQRGRLAEVHQHRARLAELDALLERLYWSGPPEGERVALRASKEVLHDALYGALIDAGERLATTCARAWRGEVRSETVSPAAQEVIALDRLLQSLEA